MYADSALRQVAGALLATSANTDQLVAMLAALDLPEGAVDHKTNKDEVEQSKPAPDIFRAAMEDSGLTPERAVVVGDTIWDHPGGGELRAAGGGRAQWRDDPARPGGGRGHRRLRGSRRLLAHLDDSPLAELLSPPYAWSTCPWLPIELGEHLTDEFRRLVSGKRVAAFCLCHLGSEVLD